MLYDSTFFMNNVSVTTAHSMLCILLTSQNAYRVSSMYCRREYVAVPKPSGSISPFSYVLGGTNGVPQHSLCCSLSVSTACCWSRRCRRYRKPESPCRQHQPSWMYASTRSLAAHSTDFGLVAALAFVKVVISMAIPAYLTNQKPGFQCKDWDDRLTLPIRIPDPNVRASIPVQ